MIVAKIPACARVRRSQVGVWHKELRHDGFAQTNIGTALFGRRKNGGGPLPGSGHRSERRVLRRAPWIPSVRPTRAADRHPLARRSASSFERNRSVGGKAHAEWSTARARRLEPDRPLRERSRCLDRKAQGSEGSLP